MLFSHVGASDSLTGSIKLATQIIHDIYIISPCMYKQISKTSEPGAFPQPAEPTRTPHLNAAAQIIHPPGVLYGLFICVQIEAPGGLRAMSQQNQQNQPPAPLR